MSAARTVGEALLLRLRQLGVDYFFANPGTEFVSVIRGFRELSPELVPEPVLAPHEFLAVSMAYGAYLGSGRAQAVMTHANVGAANAVIGLIAAARMNIPLIFLAGKTSASERHAPGRRDKIIHWAQESRDQGAMYREYVKWEAEIRDESCLHDVLDRAYAIAMTEPRGPVAISISRGVLVSERLPAFPEAIGLRPAQAPAPQWHAQGDLFSAFARAKKPLLVTNRLGADPGAVPLLVKAAESHGFGVVTPDDFYLSFPAGHAQHLGFKQTGALAESDFVIVLEADVPWYPLDEGPSADAVVVHVGQDPLAEAIPLRSHRGSHFLRAGAKDFLSALGNADPDATLVAARKAWCARMKAGAAPSAGPAGFTAADVSAVLGTGLGPDTVLINELGLSPERLGWNRPGSYFRSGNASPLGWGVGCALGLAIVDRGKIPILCVGDGVFFLSPMLAAFALAAQRGIPLVVVILNNGGYRSISAATRDFYPGLDGGLPLTSLQSEGTRLEKCAEVVGGWGARASSVEELRAALVRGIEFTVGRKKPVIIDVVLREKGK